MFTYNNMKKLFFKAIVCFQHFFAELIKHRLRHSADLLGENCQFFLQHAILFKGDRIAVVDDKPPVSGEKSVVCFAIAIHTIKCYERTAFCPK